MSGSDTTAIYVHESRYPLRFLKQLKVAGPKGKGAEVKRLDALFRYEANASLPSTSAQARTSDTQVDGSREHHAAGAASQGKGKGRESDRHMNAYERAEPPANLDNSTGRILTFESPIDGTVAEWCVKEGDYLTDPYKPVARIYEPCKHPVQLGGLCAICGKDLTGTDYTGFSETSRASISMAHDTSELTVSLEEAARMEKQTSTRLLRQRRLSLIVDLDQTIIHATVDPTVGEWMFDERNPNYPVLRDVKRFKLLNDDGKEEDCWYYVKPRPHLAEFMQQLSNLYEMHVYTMGTRQYAENVCKIIDPNGRMFANRILSRDESGSLVRKSLERLFPVDQSMAVIIDDRADIWDWSPHLVKVVPFDFFVGIGDINSAFLPKQTSALNAKQPENAVKEEPAVADSADSTQHRSDAEVETAAISEQHETLDHQIADKPLARMQEEKSAALHLAIEHTKDQASGQSSLGSALSGAVLSQDRTANGSVSKKGSTIGRGDEDTVSDSDSSDTSDDADEPMSVQAAKDTPPLSAKLSASESAQRKAADGVLSPDKADGRSESNPGSVPHAQETSLSATPLDLLEEEAVLKEDDNELDRVAELLEEIHKRFYSSSQPPEGGVASIVPLMKDEVLRGCHIVFSGVIPLDRNPATSEIWQLAEQFGATCSIELNRNTTHLIAARRGTSKVNTAQRRRDVHIVTLPWLLNTVNLWNREPELAYLLESGSESEMIPDSPEGPTDNAHDAGETSAEEQDFNLIDWNDAEAEIQAFLDETDDEESESVQPKEPHELASGDARDSSAHARKRRASGPGNTPSKASGSTGSPLSKRRRVAAARAGQSRLKISESAEDPQEDAPAIVRNDTADSPAASTTTSTSDPSHIALASSSVSSEDDDPDLEDFARALEGGLE